MIIEPDNQVVSFWIKNIEREPGFGTLDPIQVILKNYRPGVGEITVKCFGECWTAAWGAMGGESVEAFFVSCDDGYLINRLGSGISSDQRVEFPDWERDLKAKIIERRREDLINREPAREMWKEVEEGVRMGYSEDEWHQLLYRITDDPEWWYHLPREPNPKYEYLKRIVQAVREGLKMWMEQSYKEVANDG